MLRPSRVPLAQSAPLYLLNGEHDGTELMATIANVRPVDDPLSRVLESLPNESAERRAERIAEDALARQISNEIDEYIKKEVQKKQKVSKLLLLGAYRLTDCPTAHVAHGFVLPGQAESGLSFPSSHRLPADCILT